MTDTMINASCNMVRASMQDIPLYELPAGYGFRTFRPGDEELWMGLHRAAEKFFEVKPELFEQQFGEYRDDLADRMYFVETAAGVTVASISAWWERERDNPDERGRIHWVVVDPSHQGRGLAKPMMTQAMLRLAQSHPSAMLGTSTGRTWAIKVYLDFGFMPDPVEMEEKPEVLAGWQDLLTRLPHPLLAQALAKHVG